VSSAGSLATRTELVTTQSSLGGAGATAGDEPVHESGRATGRTGARSMV
jgi:hypothetical protein